MAKFEVLASGYGVVEAPTVDFGGGVAFSDVSKGGVYRLDPDGAVETIIPKRKGVGGICLHADGGYIVSGRDITHVKHGISTILFAPSDCPAPGPVKGFNDLCADHKGRLLIGPVQPNEQGAKLPQNLLRVSAPGRAEIVYPNVHGSNGIAVDLGRRRIFHAATGAQQIIVSEIRDDDSVEIVCRFSTTEVKGIPDGLRIDAEGCIWVAFFRGGSIARFSPEGHLLHQIHPPSRMTTSLFFSGSDMMDMYIGTHDNSDHPDLGGCLFLTRAPVPGLEVPHASLLIEGTEA